MKRPNSIQIFLEKSEYCERCSATPAKTFVPGQAYTIAELVSRFERGQRLNVHANFAPGSNMEMLTDEEASARLQAEDMETDDFPPVGVYDIADVQAHYEAHQEHKRDYSRRLAEKKKSKEAQQAPIEAPQAPKDAPVNPAG